ncbi:MAG: amidohydrolase [Butyricicoccus sp.]|nr:amidohydrolase [Butyricicoccus sp.]
MKTILIHSAHLMPIGSEPIDCGFVLTENGKIASFGPMSECPQTADEVIDGTGCWLLPGLVDAHAHLGLYEDSLGVEGADGNEDSDPVTPQLRVIDGVNPLERGFSETLRAGVTTVVISPGSANPVGGQMAAVKTMGRRIDDMIVRAPAAMKFALGENPKMVYRDKEETPVTRMATAALIRETLHKAVEYDTQKKKAADDPDADEPDYDMKYEALLPVLHGEVAAHFHAHRADDMFTALRIAKEFGLRPVLVHGTEGHLVADILAEEGVPVISGPFMTDRSKPELRALTEQNPGVLARAGIPTAITCDHPETPLKYLCHAAAVAVRAGMDENDALRAITLTPAEIADIADRVGSIAVGKDADLLLLSGHPFDYKTTVRAVLCDGRVAYRAE